MPQSKVQEKIFAAVGNRGGALLLDLLLVTLAASPLSDTAFAGAPAILLLALLYFWGMPLCPLQGTLGKWICRIKVCDRFGRRLTWRAAGVRAGAMMCWCGLAVLFIPYDPMGGRADAVRPGFWLLFYLPWAPAGFLPRRESLFDLLAGSLVVRYGADTETVARAEPVQKPGILNVGGAVLLCLFFGLTVGAPMIAQHDRDRRARVGYAIRQTETLREKVGDFHEREKRWPTAEALGVAEWTPYPEGGGYRLQADGRIVISFTVLPDLKGHTLTLRPATEGKAIQWRCIADAGFPRQFLPVSCR